MFVVFKNLEILCKCRATVRHFKTVLDNWKMDRVTAPFVYDLSRNQTWSSNSVANCPFKKRFIKKWSSKAK